MSEDVRARVDAYIDGVIGGTVPACRLTRLAVERHLHDLENAEARGYYFDEDPALAACEFFPTFLRHYKDRWAGEPFELSPWQTFCQWVLYGWLRDVDGTRRYRTAFIMVPRKNGKTHYAAGNGIYLFIADGVEAAEVYSSATKFDQAAYCHRVAKGIISKSPALRPLIIPQKFGLEHPASNSVFLPLSSDYHTQDGLNPNGVIVDEYHAHRDAGALEVMDSGLGAREQPLVFIITTAGDDEYGPCHEMYAYSREVLEASVPEHDPALADDTHFAFITGIDEERKDSEGRVVAPGDDWKDEAVWCKANPDLGTLVDLEDMRRQARRARSMESARASFLQKRLNIWVESSLAWLPMAGGWDLNDRPITPADLKGRPCYGGLDLASNTDLASLCLCFPPPRAFSRDDYIFLWRYWVPEVGLNERAERDRVQYGAWVRAGLVDTTPGNVIDFDYIYQTTMQLHRRHNILELAYDRWGALDIAERFRAAGLKIMPHGQGFRDMSPPMKELERLVLAGRVRHGGNQVSRWMARNALARKDPAGNLKFDRERSRTKIDGMVAMAESLHRAVLHQGAKRVSVYHKRGFREL